MDEHTRATKTVGYRPTRASAKPFLIILAVIVLCGLSFYGGATYQKDHNQNATTTTATNTNSFGGAGSRTDGGFRGQRPIQGQVTSVSSTSITVQNATTGTSTTYSITSGTIITDNGQTVSASDIQTGDTVFIIVSSSSGTQATRILVNPSYGRGQSSQGSSTAPTTSTD